MAAMSTGLLVTGAVTLFTLQSIHVSGLQTNKDLPLKLPVVEQDLLEVYSGDHFVDVMTYTDKTFRQPTILVLYTGQCRQEAETAGMFDARSLPPLTYMNYATYNYRKWKKHAWFHFSETQDLSTLHNITSCPTALFWEGGVSCTSEPARWTRQNQGSFRDWLSEKLCRLVTLRNDGNHGVSFTLGSDRDVAIIPVEAGSQTDVRVLLPWAKPVIARQQHSGEILQAWFVSHNGQILQVSNQSEFLYSGWLEKLQRDLNKLWKLMLEVRADHAERHLLMLNEPTQVPFLTKEGYKRLHIPEALHQQLLSVYRNAKSTDFSQHLNVTASSSIFNDDEFLMEIFFLPGNVSEAIIEQVEPLVEKWCGGCKLRPQTINNNFLRRYHKGSMIRMHVDKVASSKKNPWLGVLLQIDQNLQGAPEWNFTVIGRDGEWHSFSNSPGDMIFFEARGIPHGRPQALQGESFVNAFVFFEVDEQNSGDLSGVGKSNKDEL